jgi:hypothetical protein
MRHAAHRGQTRQDKQRSVSGNSDARWIPTPEEIERSAAQIREGWSPRQLQRRAGKQPRIVLEPVQVYLGGSILSE